MNKLVITKPGFNVLTETNPDNMIFSSDYNTLKYSQSGNIALSVSAGAFINYVKRTSVAHNLGYVPFFKVYVKDDIMSNYQPVGRFQAGSGASRSFLANADKNNLYFVAMGEADAGDTYTVNFYYKIFKNNLGL